MPSASAVPINPQAREARAIRWMRFCATLLIALVALACTLLLTVRYVVFPNIETWRETIAARLSRQLGQEVEIDRLAGGWNGWDPKLIVTGLRVRDGAGADAMTLLELPEVELVMSWISIVYADLVLNELVVDRPQLAIRRDRDGRIDVGGIEIKRNRAKRDGRVMAWLLRQPGITVRNALVTWDDEQRDAPHLVLERVQLRIEQQFGVHRFGLTGVPPAAVASPLELRGEWSGSSPSDWKRGQGRLYVRFDYADVVPLRAWLPVPDQLETGKGALRIWFDGGEGVARKAVADVELAEVRVRLKPHLPPLELRHLTGHFDWKEEGATRSLSMRGLQFTASNGTILAPTDGSVSVERSADDQIAAGQASIARLDLVPLAALGANLPLPERWRGNLAQLAPKGIIRDVRFAWQGPPEAPTGFSAAGAFEGLAVAAVGPLPGVTALTGSFETTEAKGTIRVSERPATIHLPRVFEEPLDFQRLGATAHWERGPDGIAARIESCTFANAHGAGTLRGRWQAVAGGPGMVDVSGTVARADLTQTWRYVPIVSVRLRDWMRRAFVKGAASDGSFTLVGSLGKSPFAPDSAVRLTLAARIQDGSLDYARQWPGATDIDGELRIDGRRLTFAATRGQVSDLKIGRASIEIPELRAPGGAVLKLDLDATGSTAKFLEFIAQSPVTGYIGNANAGVQATGEGALGLKLELGLARQKPPVVEGRYVFTNNQIRAPGLPSFGAVNGTVAFTERGVQAQDLAAEVLGGAAKFSIARVEERVRVSGSGVANLGLLRTQMPFPLSDRLSGMSDWQFTATLLPKFVAWQIDSSLKGAAVDLPAPIGKPAGDAVPLRIERRMRDAQADRDVVTVDIRDTARLVAQRRLGPSGATVERALLLVGKATERSGEANRPGIGVRIDVASLDVDEWLAVAAQERARGGAGASRDAVKVDRFELVAGTLEAAGRRFNEARITARETPQEWHMTLGSRELAGTAVWRSAGAAVPNGRLVARLARVTVPKVNEVAVSAPRRRPAAPKTGATWPELDVVSDTLISDGRDLGRMELLAKPSGADWRIDKLGITSDDGHIAVSGLWRPDAPAEKTKLDVKLEAKDAGPFLARFGYAGAVKGAPTTIEGQLAWNGPPSSIDFPTLGGNFRLTSGEGQFLKVDPGLGKLVGVLSLQALPRRLTLDFRDVFSEGFAFDEIVGRIRIHEGVMHSDDLKIVGPAAHVDISGQADLARETQQLTVKVNPGGGDLSAGTAALLLAANPIIGAAVGAGALLAQSIGVNPLHSAFSFEYKVTGSWKDPVVTKVELPPLVLPGDGTGR